MVMAKGDGKSEGKGRRSERRLRHSGLTSRRAVERKQTEDEEEMGPQLPGS